MSLSSPRTHKSMDKTITNIIDEPAKYILIPMGDQWPEFIARDHAVRLLQQTAVTYDYDKLQQVYDRLALTDPTGHLAATIRAVTPEGILIYGTMNDAFHISPYARSYTKINNAPHQQVKKYAPSIFLRDIRKMFASCVA